MIRHFDQIHSTSDSLMQAARALGYVALLVLLGALTAPKAHGMELHASADGTIVLHAPRDADEMASTLDLERGKSVVLRPDFPVKRVAVGDPSVVDFVLHGAREVQLVAKAVGSTNVLLWDREGRIQSAVEVHVGAIQSQIVREIQRVLGNSNVSVDMAGESIVLRGQVPSLAASEQAEQVASAFFARSSADADSGTDTANTEPSVINMLSVGGNHQVMIEIKIAEISRSLQKNMGANFRTASTGSSSTGDITVFSFLDSLSSIDAGTGLDLLSERISLAGTLVKDDFTAKLFLEALQREGLGKVLAEPTLVARSGETANFLVGGEIPIPVVQGNSTGVNNVTIVFKDFGVNVEFTPTVLSPERIHLLVAPEVSEPDFNFGTTVSGTTVPAFRTRRASTGVELADGQTFAIAGLLREDITTAVNKIPALGELPIFGTLFRSQAFEKNQTEMMLIVTPHLVKPMGPGEIELPTDHYIEPNDFEFYVRGQIEGRHPNTGATADITSNNLDDNAPVSEAGGLIGDFGYRVPVPAPKGDN